MPKNKPEAPSEPKIFSTRVPETLIDDLKLKALKEKTSVQALVNKAIELTLAEAPTWGNPSEAMVQIVDPAGDELYRGLLSKLPGFPFKGNEIVTLLPTKFK